MRLHEDALARERYLAIFRRIGALLGPDGRLVASDVGRWNLWGALGARCPFAPEIEWHKHQEPATWCDVLRDAGLEPLLVRWEYPWFRVGALAPLLGNRVAARCLASQFTIEARAR